MRYVYEKVYVEEHNVLGIPAIEIKSSENKYNFNLDGVNKKDFCHEKYTVKECCCYSHD